MRFCVCLPWKAAEDEQAEGVTKQAIINSKFHFKAAVWRRKMPLQWAQGRFLSTK